VKEEEKLRRERIPIPKPRSAFYLVQCTNCGGEQTIFSASSTDVNCKNCGTVIAEKTGGRARVNAVILRRVD
jgi:small subunit ribosomal protein S27e